MSNLSCISEPAKIENVVTTEVSSPFFCFLSRVNHEKEPVHFKQAVTDPKWVKAMNEELDALEENKTWEITTLPPSKTPIGCKWLYKTKYKPDGSIERHKSRLVVLENRQKFGIDYEETFAPVAKLTTVRSLLAIASIQGWKLQQMDFKNAFLHGEW